MEKNEIKESDKAVVKEKPTTDICQNCQKIIYFGELCTCREREDNFKLLKSNEHNK